MRSARKLSRFLTAFAAAVFHVAVLGGVGTSAAEAGVLRRSRD
ncbi:hypothetical protein OG552_19180 [Streptomyces sp. NBC_01476]|nr:hypothetical protein [Streptomyces sp. NBC_01476]